MRVFMAGLRDDVVCLARKGKSTQVELPKKGTYSVFNVDGDTFCAVGDALTEIRTAQNAVATALKTQRRQAKAPCGVFQAVLNLSHVHRELVHELSAQPAPEGRAHRTDEGRRNGFGHPHQPTRELDKVTA